MRILKISTESIKKICEIPINERKRNLSFKSLVLEARLPKVFKYRLRRKIKAKLVTNPELIDEWIIWSENQRSSDAYFFLQTRKRLLRSLYLIKQRIFVVGKLYKIPFYYSTPAKACSKFIMKNISEYIA
jgi:hypothetical protein